MKRKLLLPNKCKTIGLALLPFAIVLLIAVYHYDFSIPLLQYNLKPNNNLLGGNSDFIFSKNFGADLSGEVAMLATFISLFMVAFSAEKNEDEYVSSVRLHALQLSVYINYIVLAVTSIFIYGFGFLMVMELNLFTIPVLFILIFNFNLHIRPRLSKTAQA